MDHTTTAPSSDNGGATAAESDLLATLASWGRPFTLDELREQEHQYREERSRPHGTEPPEEPWVLLARGLTPAPAWWWSGEAFRNELCPAQALASVEGDPEAMYETLVGAMFEQRLIALELVRPHVPFVCPDGKRWALRSPALRVVACDDGRWLSHADLHHLWYARQRPESAQEAESFARHADATARYAALGPDEGGYVEARKRLAAEPESRRHPRLVAPAPMPEPMPEPMPLELVRPHAEAPAGPTEVQREELTLALGLLAQAAPAEERAGVELVREAAVAAQDHETAAWAKAKLREMRSKRTGGPIASARRHPDVASSAEGPA